MASTASAAPSPSPTASAVRAEVIGLALVLGLGRRLGGLHVHLANGINGHDQAPLYLASGRLRARRSGREQPGPHLFRRKLLVTTDTDENAIAAPARMGESSTPAMG